MKNKITLSILAISLLLITACEQATVEPAKVNIVDEDKEIKEIEDEKTEEEQQEISPEVKELLETSDKKVQNLSYSYKGPETKNFFYDFFVKGDNIKYTLDPTHKVIDVDEDAYDTIYINKKQKTAQAYCDNRKCKVKGKKADLNYEEAYIWTPLDWVNNVEFAEKAGEELIEQRSTWKLLTNQGTMWVDTYYGIPMQVEFTGNKYQFIKISFNDVKDDDIIPRI